MIVILILNFILRLIIYWNTHLFNFSDYKVYLNAIDIIKNNESIPLVGGNFLFSISYIGFLSKYILGSLDYFFIFNCFLGTLTTLIVALFVIKVSGNPITGLITAFLLTFYTEFMVFSSVFYTQVIMLLLLSLFVFSLFNFYKSSSKTGLINLTVSILMVFLATFFFKPELIFFPLFLLILVIIFIRKQRAFVQRSIVLAIILIFGILALKVSGLYNKQDKDVIANDFIFFGHTSYGGDGGEGSFIYPENEFRYDVAWKDYCLKNELVNPTNKDRNRFQLTEINKFVIHHPLAWVKLQFTKFFRTFGVVPETTSFKVLYIGLFKGNLWLTSIVVVAPVAIIILLFIFFFNCTALKNLLTLNKTTTLDRKTARLQDRKTNYFLYIYFLLFLYYLIATIFFGQYQERYRLPLMVVFIIPALSYSITSYNKEQFFKKSTLVLKSSFIALFLTIWVFQAKNAISNKNRLQNAIELIESQKAK